MPRLPRLNLPGFFYHVMMRGIEGTSIFRQDSDRRDFLNRLMEGLDGTQSYCFAWALMTNHVHLLILAGAKGISSLMQPLLTGYATAFNLKYNRVGHLFQNRFKAIICQEEPYFLQLVRYIHLNPVVAGIIRTIEELNRYAWTGHSALVGTLQYPWQQIDPVLARFGKTPDLAIPRYEQFILDGWDQGMLDQFEGGGLIRSAGGIGSLLKRSPDERELGDPRILGDGAFVEQILKQAGVEERRQRVAQKQWSKEALHAAIARIANTPKELVFSNSRTRAVSDLRAMVAFASTEWLQMPASEVANWLGVSPAAVSQARIRGRTLATEQDLWELLGVGDALK